VIGTAWVLLCTTAIRIVQSGEAARERADVATRGGISTARRATRR